MGSSTWQEGATAARAGTAITDCPYTHGDWAVVVWTNGWTTARHTMAMEAKRGEDHSNGAPAVTPVDDDLFGEDNSDLF